MNNVLWGLGVLGTIAMMLVGCAIAMVVVSNAFIYMVWNIPALIIGVVVACFGSYYYGVLMGD